jgi:environmental stress-induced protein Ves
MPTPTILRKENYKRSTWKNGLGHTDEIAIYPPGANLGQGNFLWRLSSARIENAAPFSVFPAHDRVLVILKGKGLRLTHTFEEGADEEMVEIGPLEPYEFPGDVPSRCELLGGAVTDFSVFLRKAEVEPLIEIRELAEEEEIEIETEGKWNFVFLMEGQVETPAGLLTEGNTLSMEYAEMNSERKQLSLRAVSASKMLCVSLG